MRSFLVGDKENAFEKYCSAGNSPGLITSELFTILFRRMCRCVMS